MDDCPDASDEEDCNILALDETYRASNFPILKSNLPLQGSVADDLNQKPTLKGSKLEIFVAEFFLHNLSRYG